MGTTADDKDVVLLHEIENVVYRNLDLGFDPAALEILDDEDATAEEINSLQGMIDREIVASLFKIGASAYHSRLQMGECVTFNDLMLCIGMWPAKIYVLSLSLFSLDRGPDFRELFARSVGTSALARVLMEMGNYEDDVVKKAQLGGLFAEVGKVIMLMYRKEKGKDSLTDEFIEKHHTYFFQKIIEDFRMPHFLNDIVSFGDNIVFDEDTIILPSVVYLARMEVIGSFRKYGKLRIGFLKRGPEDPFAKTPVAEIKSFFDILSLTSYLEIENHTEQMPTL
ncbi:MAG: HDOD domain-containing protein [Thermodesulfovibrionales bacterium]